MKERLRVNGTYTVKDYRAMLDEQSCIPGLPRIHVVETTQGLKADLKRIRKNFPDAQMDLVPQSSLVDGTIELVPMIVLPGLFAKEGGGNK